MKRGISPLMATALLIAFAISFGIFAMVLGTKIESGSSEKKINSSEVCKNIKMEFLSLRYKPYLCLDTEENFIKFIAVNKGKYSIESIHLILVGNSVFVRELLEEPLSPHYLYEGNIEYDISKYGMIKEMQFIPRVKSPETDTLFLCINDPHIIKDISICSEDLN